MSDEPTAYTSPRCTRCGQRTEAEALYMAKLTELLEVQARYEQAERELERFASHHEVPVRPNFAPDAARLLPALAALGIDPDVLEATATLFEHSGGLLKLFPQAHLFWYQGKIRPHSVKDLNEAPLFSGACADLRHECYLFYIDLEPLANWGHSTYYVLIGRDLYLASPGNYPPSMSLTEHLVRLRRTKYER